MSGELTKTIHSILFDPSEFGSKNNTPIRAIGVFDIDLSTFLDTDQLTLLFPNKTDNRTEEIRISVSELKIRLKDYQQGYPLVFWLLPNGQLYNTSGIGIEGEWYWIAGGMAKNTDLDFTLFRV